MQSALSTCDIRAATDRVLSRLSPFWREFRGTQVPRVCEELSWIAKPGGTVVDLGGSSAFHASVCVELGMRAICVDNCLIRPRGSRDDKFFAHDIEAVASARKFGVEYIEADLLTWEPPFGEESVDICMSFDAIEHLPRSPRSLFQKLVGCMKRRGRLLLGAPNAANILKRWRMLMGQNVFASFDEWYMYPSFNGHVREPVVEDYSRLASDLGLQVVEIAGRNWLGLSGGRHRSRVVSEVARFADWPLRLAPTLCSDIYLLAEKPQSSPLPAGWAR
jgi:SAM-dependent methyltransferase